MLREVLAIEADCDAVVGLGRVEVREVQLVDAIGALNRAGPGVVHTVRQPASDHPAGELRSMRAGLVGDGRAVDGGAGLRDDVHHREERAVAVERRRRAADDLHAFERGRIETELRADFRLAEDVVVDAMAVDQEQNPAVVVARLAEPARAEEAEIAIVAHVHAAHTLQDVGKRPVAVTGDVLGGDERDRCRRFGHRLAALRRAEDAAGVEAHEIFK